MANAKGKEKHFVGEGTCSFFGFPYFASADGIPPCGEIPTYLRSISAIEGKQPGKGLVRNFEEKKKVARPQMSTTGSEPGTVWSEG